VASNLVAIYLPTPSMALECHSSLESGPDCRITPTVGTQFSQLEIGRLLSTDMLEYPIMIALAASQHLAPETKHTKQPSAKNSD
jgi:hypothetical protein